MCDQVFLLLTATALRRRRIALTDRRAVGPTTGRRSSRGVSADPYGALLVSYRSPSTRPGSRHRHQLPSRPPSPCGPPNLWRNPQNSAVRRQAWLVSPSAVLHLLTILPLLFGGALALVPPACWPGPATALRQQVPPSRRVLAVSNIVGPVLDGTQRWHPDLLGDSALPARTSHGLSASAFLSGKSSSTVSSPLVQTGIITPPLSSARARPSRAPVLLGNAGLRAVR